MPHRVRAAVAALVLALLAGGALAQDGPPAPSPTPTEPAPEPINVATVESRMAALEASPALAEEDKVPLLDAYRQALDQLKAADRATSRATEFERLTQAAPSLAESIKSELQRSPEEIKLEAPPDASLAQVEQLQAQAEAELAAARQHLEELRTESSRRAERRAALTEQVAQLNQRLAAVEEQLGALPPSEQAGLAELARRTLLRAQRKAILAEILASRAEVASFDARVELLPRRRDRAQRRVSHQEKVVEGWQRLAGRRRQEEAEARAAEARRLARELARKTPEVQLLTAVNEELAQAQRDEVVPRLARVDEELSAAKQTLADLRKDFGRVRRKIDAAGLTQAMGLLLRRKLDVLPDVVALEARARELQEEIAAAQYQLIVYEEQRADAGDVDGAVRSFLATVARSRTEAEREELERAAREVFSRRVDLYDELIRLYGGYFDKLVELDTFAGEVITGTQEFRSYIQERILWIRSVTPLPAPPPWNERSAQAPPLARLLWPVLALRWLFDAEEWSAGVHAAGWFLVSNPLDTAGWLVLLAAVFLLGRIGRRRLHREPATLQSPYWHTLRDLATTVLLAARLPLLLLACSWALSGPPRQSPAVLAAAGGLAAAAQFLVFFELLRNVLRTNGLAEAHFRWRTTSIGYLRRQLRWFIPVTMVCGFLIATMDRQDNNAFNDALGRGAFVLWLLTLAVFNQRILRPAGPVFGSHFEVEPKSWLSRLRWLWFPAAILVPVAFAVMALQGYYYTTLALQGRLMQSLWLVLGLVLLNALLMRWLRLTRRRIWIEQAFSRSSLSLGPPTLSAAAIPTETGQVPRVEEQAGPPKPPADVLDDGLGSTLAAGSGPASLEESGDRDPPPGGGTPDGPRDGEEADEPHGPGDPRRSPAPDDAEESRRHDEGREPAAGATGRFAGGAASPSRATDRFASASDVSQSGFAASPLRATAGLDGHGAPPGGDGGGDPPAAPPPPPPPPPPDPDQVDLLSLDAHTRQLFRTVITLVLLVGFYATWSPVFPALRRLNQYRVWPRLEQVEAAHEDVRYPTLEPEGVPAAARAGAPGVPPGDAPPPEASAATGPLGALASVAPAAEGANPVADTLPNEVTVADIGLALIVFAFTLAAVKNIPAFLEILLLQRLPLDAGARYAITTVARYLIVVAGVSFALGAVGIGWSNIQWLAAALTFGLAFGLQEIFANFISGLIILFERPVRVGDVVTLGTISGTVSRIRIRATTIVDWDRKELVIPNKEFVTGQVVNWSLTDPVLRVVIPVGIAYGSDTELARRLLLEVAESHPVVLKDPEPMALFRSFGDSALNFELRCFVPDINVFVTTLHDLLMEVDQTFRRHDVQIAFPQRDLHIRSADPLVGIAQDRKVNSSAAARLV